MAADGSIIINTKLDTSGINAGTGNIQKASKAAAVNLKQMNDAIKGQEKDVASLSAELDKLMAQYNEWRDLGISPDDNVLTQFDIEKITPAAAALDEAKSKLDAMKTSAAKLAAENNRLAASKKHVEAATKKATSTFESFGKRISMLAKRVFFYSIVLRGLRAVYDYFKKVSKTSSELTTAMARLKGALITAFTPIWEAILPSLIVFVNVLTKVVLAIAAFFSWLTGKSLGNAEGLYKQAEAIEGVGKAADKTKKSLAGFDEINNISTNEDAGRSGGGSKTNAPKFDFDMEYLEKAKNLFDKIGQYVVAIGLGIAAWNIAKALGALPKIAIGLGLVVTGISIAVGNIQKILAGERKHASLEAAFDEIVSGLLIGAGLMLLGAGVWAIPLAVVLTMTITSIIVNWDKIEGWASGMWQTISGMFEGDSQKAWEGIETSMDAYYSADTWWNKLARAIWGDELWDSQAEILKGIITDVSGWFTQAWEDIKNVWATVSEWFDTNVIQPLVNFFAPIVAWISEFFRGCWLIIQAVWKVVSEWFNTNVIQPIVNFFKPIIEWIGGIFKSLWEAIKTVWGAVSKWFNDNVIQPIVKFFTKAWDAIKGAFETAFTAISNFAKGIFNGVIGFVESVINKIIRAINGLIEGFNKVVTWAAGVVGADWKGLTLLQEVNLPRLAQGTVVPRNREFTAVLGDNKHETEIVSPLSTMKQALLEALQESGGGDINLTVLLDGDVVHKSVVKRNSQTTRRTGRNPMLTGV